MADDRQLARDAERVRPAGSGSLARPPMLDQHLRCTADGVRGVMPGGGIMVVHKTT